jgi:serine/threonine protein kinase
MAKSPIVFETAFSTYKVHSTIGEGGTGRVYEVADNDSRTYALKCLRPEGVSTERRRRFQNELAFCFQNKHPRILTVIDWGVSAQGAVNSPFYVMQRYPRTLRHVIQESLSNEVALEVLANLLDGVEAAHLKGVWHRDLKPENVLCGLDPRDLVVGDFGIAHFSENLMAVEVKTQKSSRLANLAYAAPEQRDRGAKVDQRADLFSLGLILNELFTKKIPHGVNYQTIGQLAPNLAYLDDIVTSLLHQNPEQRPATIDEIKKELVGCRNSFVARQELDREKARVVPRAQPQTFPAIELKGFDYRSGYLFFDLSAPPPQGWIVAFKNPAQGHSFIMGKGPEAFAFSGSRASITAGEHNAEALLVHFKNYLSMANQQFEENLKLQAIERERKERTELERRIQEAEERQRILSRLRA